MNINQINKNVVEEINRGSENAFSNLYKVYYSYLNAVAMCYLLDKNVGGEIVDDVFINIWDKRETLSFPIHSYLVRSVQNGCLNYIRMQRSQVSVLESHRDQLLILQETYIQSTPVPLQYVEMREAETEIRIAVNRLPLKCRQVFEAYFYKGKAAEAIAEEMNLTINTVRVHLKNALDKLKILLKHLLFLCLLFIV